MDPQNPSNFTFADLFGFLRRGLFEALIVGLIAGAVAYGVSLTLTPTYRARATVLGAQVDPELRSFGVSLVTAPPLDASAYRAALSTDPVVTGALQELGVEEPTQQIIDQVREQTSVRVEEARSSILIHIDTTSDVPEEAADLANALAQSIVEWEQQRATDNLTRIVETLRAQIRALDEQIRQMQVNADAITPDQIEGRIALRAEQQEQLYYAQALRTSAMGTLEMFQPAVVPGDPVSPKPVRNAALALIVGIFLVYGIMLLRELLDTRLRTSEDLAQVSGLPVLAEFPMLTKGERRLPREAANYLRTNVLFATTADHPKVILVSSPQASEGKSSVALSLAESFARGGHRTLLVDADLRKPVLGRELGLDPTKHHSLREHLEARETAMSFAQVAVSASKTLDVVPTFAAAPEPSELLTGGFRECLESWRASYDVIIIDSAPLLPVADTLTIAPFCTGTILAASMQTTGRRQLQAAVSLLERVGVRMLGVVATQLVRQSEVGKRYGYGYGYGYGQEPPGTEEEAGTRSSRPG